MAKENKIWPLLILAGPTGIGKTAIAMKLADVFPIDLISVDSVMVYAGLDIGTAKPSILDLQKYPHALIDVAAPDYHFNAAQFFEKANIAIKKSWANSRVPFLVGGTMLWIKLVLNGFDNLPEANKEIRIAIRQKAQEKGWPALHSDLHLLDPDGAKLIHPNHSSRIERALEVIQITGKPISMHWKKTRSGPLIFGRKATIYKLFLWPNDKQKLNANLSRRFDVMLDDGLIDEVIGLQNNFRISQKSPSMRSVGYKQVLQYLDGVCSKVEMREDACKATRGLAKRQMTWLRSLSDDATNLLVGERPEFSLCIKWVEDSLAN